jgi:hypothetical protein
VARTVAIKGIAIPDFRLNDFESPLRIMNPESQKIGIPVMNPVIPRAAALLFSPVFERINAAMLNVPPVLSRVMPIIAPRIIKKPIDPMVPPKPSLIVLIIVSAGRVVNASTRETTKRAMNACNLSLVVRIMINNILIRTRKVIMAVFIAGKTN